MKLPICALFLALTACVNKEEYEAEGRRYADQLAASNRLPAENWAHRLNLPSDRVSCAMVQRKHWNGGYELLCDVYTTDKTYHLICEYGACIEQR